MEAMKLPTPEDPANSPVWDTYIIAQAAHASLGQLPQNTQAFGVMVDNNKVTLHFDVTDMSLEDIEDIDSILADFEALVGSHVMVDKVCNIRTGPVTAVHNSVYWIFRARV